MYNASGAFAVVFIVRFRDVANSIKKFAQIAVIGLFFVLLIFPFINAFTGGALPSSL